jgi:ferric-dicitrate binding protein FerR (iron transport regulator)
MTEPPSSELLARYLSGQATPAEQAGVEVWASAASEHAAELARLHRLWAVRSAGRWDVDRAWPRVRARMDRPARRLRSRVPLALAASVTILLGGWLAWRALHPEAPGSGALPAAIATGPGERRAVTLPDGTHLILAPNSEVRMGDRYDAANREVFLSGEAWFDVRHDVRRPFRVYAGGTITEDLGTEFAVLALPGREGVRVVLVSGSASLRRTGADVASAVVLNPRDVAVLAPADSVPRVERNAAVEALVSWRTGIALFDDAPVDSVLGELSRWYGVRVSVADSSLAARRLSGPVPVDNLDEALEVITLSLGVRAERRDGAIVLTR